MLELYISGIEKNSGKTVVTAGLAATMQSLGYDTCVYKPVQTGAIVKDGFAQSPDLAFMKSVDPYIKTYFSYLFQKNDIPLIAAEAENVVIDKEELYKDYTSLEGHECIITDGCDGLSTPLAEEFLEQNFVRMLNLPVLFVVSDASVNNIVANINEAVLYGARVRGVVINNCTDKTDKNLPRLIESYTPAKVLGIVPYFENIKKINPNDLISNILEGIDIESVFDVKIAKLTM